MLETIEFKDEEYLMLQTKGHASQYAIPFAQNILSGVGFDIGCMKKEWAYPGAIPIDLDFDDPWDAYKLPDVPPLVDYIFSSHCLEHLPNYVEALEYWNSKLKPGGILFLYLPHFEQKYWRPWHNRKHIHALTPNLMQHYFSDMEDLWSKSFVTQGYDLNHAFYCVAEK